MVSCWVGLAHSGRRRPGGRPALHETHCSHAHTLRLSCGGTQGRACCCCLLSKRCPPLLWRVNLKLHTAAGGAAGGAAAPHAAPAFGLQKLARFAGEGAKGGRAAGGERRRGEKGRGCGDAQQQVLMASGWWRVQLSEFYKHGRSMCALHNNPPPPFGACAMGGGGVGGSHGSVPTSDY